MCEHPRCGKSAKFRLRNPERVRIDLCELHARIYHEKEGGKLIEFGKDPDPEERKGR